MKAAAATKQPSAWDTEVPATLRFRFRHQYDEARDAEERALTDVTPEGESMTVQSQTDDADINTIVKRMGLLGTMPDPLDISFYQDASNLPDLRAILEYGRDAEAAFLALPPDIRKRFHHSPAELWSSSWTKTTARRPSASASLTKRPLRAPRGQREALSHPPKIHRHHRQLVSVSTL